VRAEVVAHDRAAVPTDEILERRGTLLVADPMHDDAGRRQTPHLPLLPAATVEPRPASLIETDQGLREHVIEQRGVDARQPMCESIGEIPKRLRGNRQAVAIHDPRLSLERNVIEVLVEDDLDRERKRVPATWCARPGPGAVSTQPPHLHTYFCCSTWTTR
jgi:hypothetical protein